MTTPRTLPETLRAYRIGDPAGRFPVWSTEGARRVSGRWHEAGNGTLPPNQHFVEITIPRGTRYEVATADTVPGWAGPGGEAARRFGRTWYAENRSAILIVPSVVARMERNIVINTRHDDFANVTVGLETPVWWDQRLFHDRQ